MPADDCLCEFWEVFQNTSFIEHLRETVYFMCRVQNFNQQIVKNYYTGAFHAFYKRTRSSLSKVFICLKHLKLIFEEVNS